MIKADYFALDSHDDNTTLQLLQQELVHSLNKAASLSNGLGFTVHYVCGKADWKFRKDWLLSKRSYAKYVNNAEGLCQRCLATKDDWLDITEKFNEPEKIQAALQDAVGDIGLKKTLWLVVHDGSARPFACRVDWRRERPGRDTVHAGGRSSGLWGDIRREIAGSASRHASLVYQARS